MIIDKIFSVEKYWCFSYFSTKVLIRIILTKDQFYWLKVCFCGEMRKIVSGLSLIIWLPELFDDFCYLNTKNSILYPQDMFWCQNNKPTIMVGLLFRHQNISCGYKMEFLVFKTYLVGIKWNFWYLSNKNHQKVW